MSIQTTRPEHEVLYADLCELVSKNADKMSALEILAIASNMVGKIVAMQDQRKVTPAQAMEVVAKNIEHGNRQVLDQIAVTKGRC